MLGSHRMVQRMSSLGGLVLLGNAAASASELTGRITSVDGIPLAGYVQVIGEAGHVRVQHYATDSRGAFSLDIPGISKLLVVARADGYISAEREVTVGPAQPRLRLDFALFPAGGVSGRVVDETGRPVPAAEIYVRHPGEVRRFAYDQETGGVRSDDFGYFTLPFVARGRSFVIDTAAEGRLPASSQELYFTQPVLEGLLVSVGPVGQRVRVNVLAGDGRPLSGALVRLRARSDAEEYSAEQRRSRVFLRMANRMASTGPDGSVQFTGVPAGGVTLVASRPGGKPVRLEALVERAAALNLSISVP